jgi:predicted metal-dependent enzyme (double-stranded beta helix superfamily)
LLYVAPDRSFSVVALAWGPGAQTCIHDHAGWCAVAVYEGVEFEHRYRLHRDGRGARLSEAGRAVLEAGRTFGMAADGQDIHRVGNYTGDVTLSLHVYGVDIGRAGSSIKSRYDALPVVA